MAYLLDTNVVSELQKGEACQALVKFWHEARHEDELFLSVLVVGEMRRGVELRRLKDSLSVKRLEAWVDQTESKFRNRILPVTLEITKIWGRLSLRQPLPVIDGLLAATALHHRLTLVTRNTRDVSRSGVACFNPFLA